jgi:hypothetical protein
LKVSGALSSQILEGGSFGAIRFFDGPSRIYGFFVISKLVEEFGVLIPNLESKGPTFHPPLFLYAGEFSFIFSSKEFKRSSLWLDEKPRA